MQTRKVTISAAMGPAPDPKSFMEIFARLPDPRVKRTRRHSLAAILFLTLCGVICGADDLVAVERFGKARRQLLEQFVEFPSGIPSHDTIGRVLAKLDSRALSNLFSRWMQAVATATQQGVIAIDGKTLRRALDRASDSRFVHMVSAWSSANKVVLGQVAVDGKSNEITAIPKLLELLHLRGCLVTIDAMGCQTAVAEAIVDAGGDYLLAVKENQPKLHLAIAKTFHDTLDSPKTRKQVTSAQSANAGHGRDEVRHCLIMSVEDNLPAFSRWKGLRKIIMIESERTVDSKTTSAIRTFITSRATLTAKEALNAVRSHWGIENQVHWTLDVAFREDDSRLRAENAAENLVAVRHIALNLLRGVQGSKVGIKNRRLEAGWNDEFLKQVLSAYAN